MKITMSGLPGAGKGTIGEMLSLHFNIEFMSVGQFRRQMAMDRGLTIEELNKIGETESWTDKLADDHQKKLNDGNSEFIFDGRLSWYFIPRGIKLFFTVDEKIAAERILKNQRESERKFDSVEEVIEYNKKRNASDTLRYKKIYGIENCYDKNNFDIIIDTTNKSPTEVFNETIEKIIQFDSSNN